MKALAPNVIVLVHPRKALNHNLLALTRLEKALLEDKDRSLRQQRLWRQLWAQQLREATPVWAPKAQKCLALILLKTHRRSWSRTPPYWKPVLEPGFLPLFDRTAPELRAAYFSSMSAHELLRLKIQNADLAPDIEVHEHILGKHLIERKRQQFRGDIEEFDYTHAPSIIPALRHWVHRKGVWKSGENRKITLDDFAHFWAKARGVPQFQRLISEYARNLVFLADPENTYPGPLADVELQASTFHLPGSGIRSGPADQVGSDVNRVKSGALGTFRIHADIHTLATVSLVPRSLDGHYPVTRFRFDGIPWTFEGLPGHAKLISRLQLPEPPVFGDGDDKGPRLAYCTSSWEDLQQLVALIQQNAATATGLSELERAKALELIHVY